MDVHETDNDCIYSLGHTDAPFWLDRSLLDSIETPCFVFDSTAVIVAYRRLRAALGSRLVVSVKANPTPQLLKRCSNAFLDGVEVASIGELDMVARCIPNTIYVSSPALSEDLAISAQECHAIIVVDSEAQGELILRLAPRFHTPPRILIRLNAKALLERHTNDVRADHFGVDPATAYSIASRLHRAGLEVVGLHVFAGSGAFSRTAPHVVSAITPVIDEISLRLGQQLACVNLGGGFTKDSATGADLMSRYRLSLAPLMARMVVLHEVGRAIFDPGARFFTRVVSVKTIHGGHVAVCDGGLAHAFRLAQTESFVKTLARPLVLPCGSPGKVDVASDSNMPTRFVGNSCNPADVIGIADTGRSPKVGDVVMFEECGAYHTYAPGAFLSLPRARKYLVS